MAAQIRALHAPQAPTDAPQTTPQPQSPPRAVLEDRYDGLLHRRRGPNVGDYNELQTKLDILLGRLVEGVTRNDIEEDGPIVDELEGMIREHVIRRVDELGVAR